MNARIFINGKLVQKTTSKLEETPAPQKSSQRTSDILTPEKLPAPPRARDVSQASDHKQKSSLEDLVASQRFIVISLSSCPQCDNLAVALAARGVSVPAVFVKWEKGCPEYPALKAELAVHAGDSFSFPQVFSDGIYQGGYEEVMNKVENGAFDALFEEEFGATASTVQRWIDGRPMVIFSLSQCQQCDELRTMLEAQGVPTEKIFIKLDKALPQYPSLKGQLVKLIGRSQFTFPQTFIKSAYQGNFEEVTAKCTAGQFDDFFSDTFGVAPRASKSLAPCEQIAFDEDF